MTPDQLRILAGIKPIPSSRKDLPPPVIEATRFKQSVEEAQKLAGMKVTEAAPVTPAPAAAPAAKPVEQKVAEAYKESTELEADLSKVREYLKAATKIMISANMRQHIKDTHDNYGVQAQAHANMVVKALEMAEHNVDAFYEKLDSAH